MKVYIVEDHEGMRVILKRLLKKNVAVIEEILESETAEKALEEIPGWGPDLVLVDISLPRMDGIELIKRLKRICNALCILVVTGHDIDMYRDAALAAGADGIVAKGNNEELLFRVKRILESKKERA